MSTNLEIHGITILADSITTLADSLGCTDETTLSVHLDHPVLVNCSTTNYLDLHVERPQDPLDLPLCKTTSSMVVLYVPI